MKKTKIALVIPTHFNTKSSLHALLNAYKYLMKKKNIEVTIFTDQKNKNVNYPGFKVQKVRSLDFNTPIEKILFLGGIPRYYYTDLIEKLKDFDVIETSNPEFYWFAYQSYIAAKKYKIRLVYRTSQTVDGFFLFHLTKHAIRLGVKKAYNYASGLIFTNPEAAKRCLRLGFQDDNKKFIITGHSVDTKTFKPIKTKKSKNFTILSVGGLYKIKGHHLIIEAVSKIINNNSNNDSKNNSYKNIELKIVGDGYYKKELINLTKQLNIEKNVKFLGSLDHKKLVNEYNKADLFVLANFQEITPAVNESLACGTPVVVMECGGRDFVIPNENYGLVSKKFNTENMAEKIETMINNSKLRKKLAINGRKRILNNFSMESFAKKLYKGLTGKSF